MFALQTKRDLESKVEMGAHATCTEPCCTRYACQYSSTRSTDAIARDRQKRRRAVADTTIACMSVQFYAMYRCDGKRSPETQTCCCRYNDCMHVRTVLRY